MQLCFMHNVMTVYLWYPLKYVHPPLLLLPLIIGLPIDIVTGGLRGRMPALSTNY